MTERSIDLDTVLEAVGGTLVPNVREPAGSMTPDGSPAAAPATGVYTRLSSPAAAVAGTAGPESIVIFGDRAELERFAAAAGVTAAASTVTTTATAAVEAAASAAGPYAATGTLPGHPGLLVVGAIELPALPAGVTVVQVADTRSALARLSELLDARVPTAVGRHPTAVVLAGARVAEDASLGAGAVVAEGAVIGAGSVIGPNSYVGRGSVVGSLCTVHANVSIYDGVTLGDRVILHSGAVIGADGFGYAASAKGAAKIRHAGGVVLQDDVEIGANTAVDRGTIDDTSVGARTKIDNLCQVGHNVTIGSDCLIAGTAAIGGSVTIGKGVIVGGNVAISDHVTIGDGARIAGRSGVTKDIPDGETWAGFPARPYRAYVRSLYLGDRLEQIWEYVKRARARDE
jgi:UDP-3-O-[3-hydroxymyristoyl] glucosamine N-acyltransferase